MIAKGLLCVFLFGVALAQNYGDDQDTDEQQLSYSSQGYNPNQYDTGRAEPYDFGFQSTDEFGTIMNRQESSDNNGAVRGSYGYTDPHGVFRHVDYVADEYGFRAEVKSNEPGMGTQSPANVQIYAEPPPAGVIVERAYHHHPHGHGHAHAASGQQATRRNPSGAGSSNAAVRQVRPSSGRSASSGASVTRTVYPYAQPQHQNTYSSNSVSSNNQYPATVSSQYAANSAAVASSGNQYSTEYSASSAGASAATGYQASASAYPASVYPARNPYGSQGYSTLTSTQYGSSAGSASSGSQQAPIVAKPYDGPTYKIGNPHVTEFKRSDKQHGASYLLPTVVATGNAPTTLVKHIHTYPAQA
ncbi:hypothetical protein JTE90_014565 [Oedothorax gibbosus]|uniref:Cuticle protein n=1 Tax=Oedothorax gibbosus TaxID=931172 RepID=A0AAV6UES6_9ARAC|nr:hypothetical protein JTE90_014565 [Oedothorax gibbosus]